MDIVSNKQNIDLCKINELYVKQWAIVYIVYKKCLCVVLYIRFINNNCVEYFLQR